MVPYNVQGSIFFPSISGMTPTGRVWIECTNPSITRAVPENPDRSDLPSHPDTISLGRYCHRADARPTKGGGKGRCSMGSPSGRRLLGYAGLAVAHDAETGGRGAVKW
jgi:hypothetical protein